MPLIAGIDEAGYGPLLGPLAVSAVAFRASDRHAQLCLWDLLKESCTREASARDHRLAVADSKKLFRPRNGGDALYVLERTVLVTLAAAGRWPRSWRGLLAEVAPGAASQLDAYPWYARSDAPVPLDVRVGDIATRANALRRNLGEQSVEFLGGRSELLAEGHFNDLMGRVRNKASVLMCMVLRLLEWILHHEDDHVLVRIDRLGGRVHYREAVTTLLPGHRLEILEESDKRSRYRLSRPPRTCEIEFVVDGDDRHFPVALASMVSKYLREGAMRDFNRYWCNSIPGLRPTAGYYADAQRWISEAQPALERLQVDPAQLIRVR